MKYCQRLTLSALFSMLSVTVSASLQQDALSRLSKLSSFQLGQHLMGAALGLKGDWKGFYYDVFVGRPIRKPEGFRTSDAVAGFNLGYRF